MGKISEVDKNLSVCSCFEKTNLCWINANSDRFNLKGIFYDGDCYKRIPKKTATDVSVGVAYLNRHTSGGRLLFETDSSYIAVSARCKPDHMSHMPFTGSKGFDFYIFENGEFQFIESFIPPSDLSTNYESLIDLKSKKLRKLMIHFPLYSGVDELNIGLESESFVEKFDPYRKGELFVYYGSSITQGGCASRPGNNYPAIVSRETVTDFLCLGFSGNAHGEDEMAEYIANLPMSCFVMDYDHNDINEPKKLSERHTKMYRKIRKKNPNIPIIIMTAPWTKKLEKSELISREIVLKTYEDAKKNGDNVYFIDGQTMLGAEYRDCATVDGCHPNDFGFVKMAQAVLNVIKENKIV